MLFNDPLHGFDEVVGLLFVLVVFFAADALSFAVCDLFLEAVEEVHGVRVLAGDESWFNEAFSDEVGDVSWCGRYFAEFHERGVCCVDDGPVQVYGCLEEVPVRVVDGCWRAGEVGPDAFSAWPYSALEEQVLDGLEEACIV